MGYSNGVKIKVFRFEVSNCTSAAFDDDYRSSWYKQNINKLSSEEDIENEINSFCDTHNIINIKTDTIDVNYHNNARGNTIHLIYTIIYQE